MNIFSELKRRNVFKVGIAYLALSWVVIQIADVMVPALGLPEILITIAAFIGLIGFPFALFFAWAYELTPDGVKPTKEVDLEDSIRASTGQKINYIIIGLLSVAVIFLLYDRSNNSVEKEEKIVAVAPEASDDRENTIAVMPFADMSPDGSQEYFGDGIAEEILNVLVSVNDLKVTSRTSSFAYKDTNAQIPQIAEELNVNYVLEGSIRTAGDNVRVTAQLIDVAADQHLWSDTFDRSLSDIFAIQDEISLAISDALQVELLGDQIGDIPTENMEAYELYLQARQLIYVPNTQSVAEALELVKRAVELDPEFAQGWAELAGIYGLNVLWNSRTDEQGEEFGRLGVEAANRAIALDPSIVTSWSHIASSQSFVNNWQTRLSSFQRLTLLAPNDPASWSSVGLVYTVLGWFDEAEEAYEKTVELEPENSVHYSILGRTYISNDKLELGRKTLQKSIEMGYGPARTNMMMLNLVDGDINAAKENNRFAADTAVSFDPELVGKLDRTMVEFMHLMTDAYFNPELREEYVKYVPDREPLALVTGSMLLQNGEVLVRSLDQPDSIGVMFIVTYLYAPPFRGMINQPAIKEFYNSIGLPQFWRETKFPNFCRPVGSDDFECQDIEGNWP